MALKLYGITNCDTVKKARAWLGDAGVAYQFCDLKAASAEPAVLSTLISTWVAALGWEVVLNRAGTTFKALPDAKRTGIDGGKAIGLMLAQPSMIKRPVLVGEIGGAPVLLVGFKPEIYAGLPR